MFIVIMLALGSLLIMLMIYNRFWCYYNNDSSGAKRIAMISTHGYFDTEPILGRVDTGGQIVYVLNLVKALSKYGYKVDIFTRWFDKNKTQVEDIPNCTGCRLIRVAAGPWTFVPKEQLYPYLSELSANIVEFIRDNHLNYDLYHGHYVDAGIVTMNICDVIKKPSFFTLHSLGIWKKQQMNGDPLAMEQKYKFNTRIHEEKRIFDRVNCIITTTHLEKEKVRNLMNYHNNNVHSIPCGVDTDYFKPSDHAHSSISSENSIEIAPMKYVFCLSRIDANKGHDLLLDAWQIVLKHVPDVRLIIGGGSKNPKQQTQRETSVLNKMRTFIKKNKMQNNVEIVGYVDHYNGALLSYYQRCEFFVLPSLFEPFGITALEAMACGKCVIATKYGGISTIITHEKDGLLVDTTNAAQFASRMIRVLKDNDFRDKLQQNAYKTIHSYYKWNIIANQCISLYSDYCTSSARWKKKE